MKKLLVGILTLVISLSVRFLITIGIIKLITLCFDLKFSIVYATGIWLVMLLLKNTFETVIRK